MDSAERIRAAIAAVGDLRGRAREQPNLGAALHWVKSLQARRFRRTYADLLASAEFGPAALFFLDELYGEQDFSARDQQFSQIAGTLDAVFPEAIVQTAVRLAELHHLTETLDLEMAQYVAIQQPEALSSKALRTFDPTRHLAGLEVAKGSHRAAGVGVAFPLVATDNGPANVSMYLDAWRSVGRRDDRVAQLQSVMDLGHALGKHARMPGLGMMLKLMRKPAARAGLGALQTFLEAGFQHFRHMQTVDGGVETFLETIRTRETALIDLLFAGQDQALREFRL